MTGNRDRQRPAWVASAPPLSLALLNAKSKRNIERQKYKIRVRAQPTQSPPSSLIISFFNRQCSRKHQRSVDLDLDLESRLSATAVAAAAAAPSLNI